MLDGYSMRGLSASLAGESPAVADPVRGRSTAHRRRRVVLEQTEHGTWTVAEGEGACIVRASNGAEDFAEGAGTAGEQRWCPHCGFSGCRLEARFCTVCGGELYQQRPRTYDAACQALLAPPPSAFGVRAGSEASLRRSPSASSRGEREDSVPREDVVADMNRLSRLHAEELQASQQQVARLRMDVVEAEAALEAARKREAQLEARVASIISQQRQALSDETARERRHRLALERRCRRDREVGTAWNTLVADCRRLSAGLQQHQPGPAGALDPHR